ncbi:MAG TPA: VOC family protein [Ignavibacteriaceae bacterium]|nr:VOC family protein [Ignavibacteriaceae bacterium]
MNKITPSLWFDNNIEEAVNFYCSIFKNSEITSVSRYGDAGFGKKGDVLAMSFKLNEQEFQAINGGPMYQFNPAVSFSIDCNDQKEVDYYWEKLSDGGAIEQCGWLRDKYGLSWQIVPNILPKYLMDKDPLKANRVMQAMLKMKKLEIDVLKNAYDGMI